MAKPDCTGHCLRDGAQAFRSALFSLVRRRLVVQVPPRHPLSSDLTFPRKDRQWLTASWQREEFCPMALPAWNGQLHVCATYVVMFDNDRELFRRVAASRLEQEASWQAEEI
jgi:hypothetical protein